MSSKSININNNNNNVQQQQDGEQENAYEITSIAFASVMIVVSLLVILLNLRLYRRIVNRRKHPIIRKLRRLLNKFRDAVKSGRLSATETVILALEAGMSLEDVRLEYVNSSGNREQILESVFGKLAHKFFVRLKASGRFMETGFANEKTFLDLWNSASYREFVELQNRQECRTQTLILEAFSSQQSVETTTEIVKKENPDRSARQTDPPKRLSSAKEFPKKRAKSKIGGLLPEGRPLLCAGKNDDAQ